MKVNSLAEMLIKLLEFSRNKKLPLMYYFPDTEHIRITVYTDEPEEVLKEVERIFGNVVYFIYDGRGKELIVYARIIQ